MQCLNIKNPEVAALLKEYTEILGSENAAYYVLSENNGYGLDKAPNGEPSKLFSDLLEHYNGDRVAAIQAKARTYSKSFKEWFGDWEKAANANRVSLGKEIPNTDKYSKYGQKGETDVEIREVLDEKGTVIGTVRMEFSGKNRKGVVTLHPNLTVTGKGYGTALYQHIADKYNINVEESFGEIGKSEAAKRMWDRIHNAVSRDPDTPLRQLTPSNSSKVVDENGEPLVVYHHANSPINEFSIEFDNYFSTIKNGTKKALFFTGTANPKKGTVLDREYKFPVFLKANTVIEKTGTKDDLKKQGESFTATINRAAEGADIAIFHGIDDNQELNQNIYVINNPNNVKSIDNQGTFSTQDNNIYNQEAATQNTTGRNIPDTDIFYRYVQF